MKRAITGIVAAGLALGMMAPAAFAATTTKANTLTAAGAKTIALDGSTLYAGVQTGTALDSGNVTQYFPIYYLMQTLTKAGYTNAYNATTATWDITMPGVNASDVASAVAGGVGTGNASISINGTVVKKFNAQWAKDLAGGKNAQVTTYFPLYYLSTVLKASGFSNAWDGFTFNFSKVNTSPAVTAVKGLNGVQVEVDFNTAVDSTDGAVLTHYALNGVHPTAVSLSTDGKTATLTFPTASDVDVTGGAFVVTPVKTAADANTTTATYAGLFTFDDTTLPTVSSVSSVTNSSTASSVKLTFSEPIQSLGTVKIDGVLYTPSSFTPGGTTATFSSGLALDVSKTHTLQIIGLTDEAGNVTANYQSSFSVTKDTAAPVATLTTQGDHTILITFSKQMDPSTVLAALASSQNAVKDELLNNVAYSNAAVVANSNNTQFTVSVTSPLYSSTQKTRTLNVVLPSTITDYLGNTLAATTQKVTLTEDTTAPAITGVTYKTDGNGNVTDIVVSVSKGVYGGTVTPSNQNLTIVNDSGVLEPTAGTGSFLGGLQAASTTAGDTTIDFPVVTPAALTGTYHFTFGAGFVEDNAQTPNSSATTSFSVNFGAASTVTSFTYSGVDSTTTNNTLVVNFGTAVKGGAVAGSATDLSNYSLDGTALPSGTTIYLNGAQTAATITLPVGSIATDDNAAVFTINNVQSLAGQTVKPVTTTVYVKDNTAPVLQSAQVIGNTILLTYNENVAVNAGNATSDYTVQVGGVNLTNATSAASVQGNAKEVLLTVSGSGNWDNTKAITVTTGSGTDVKDTSALHNVQKSDVTVTAN